MSDSMLAKMRGKLAKMETEWSQLFNADPRHGHGGTPFIVDTAHGRLRMCQHEKYQDRLRSLHRQIEEQKEKIVAQENRIAYRSTQTKKSKKFLADNTIHPGLLKLAEQGVLSQWKRNPEYFFINELDRVALITVGERVGVAQRFPAKNGQDWEVARRIVEQVCG